MLQVTVAPDSFLGTFQVTEIAYIGCAHRRGRTSRRRASRRRRCSRTCARARRRSQTCPARGSCPGCPAQPIVKPYSCMAAFQWRPHACNTAVLSHASHAPCAHAVLHQSFCPAASACSHRACGGSSRACTGAPSLSVQLRLHAIIAHGEVTHIEGRFLDTLLGFAWGLKGDVRHGRGVHGQSRQGACICTSEDARSIEVAHQAPRQRLRGVLPAQDDRV